jgi:hypothetical protein
MKSITLLCIEASVVGLCLIGFVYAAAILVSPLGLKPSLPDVCRQWNEFYTMEVTLFIAGFLFHMGFEILGINKWYVDNYYAAKPMF